MDLTGDIKVVKDGSGNTIKAKSVILAMGSAYKEIGLESEKRLSGRGVSWCATCDGFFFRNQEIAVVGGDGIGPDVINEGLKVLDVVAKKHGLKFETTDFKLGAAHFHKTGEVLHDSTMAEIAKHDAIFLGAVGDPGAGVDAACFDQQNDLREVG